MPDPSTRSLPLLSAALVAASCSFAACSRAPATPAEPAMSQEQKWVLGLQHMQTPEGGRAADAQSDRYDQIIAEMKQRQEGPLVESFNTAFRNSRTFAADVSRAAFELKLRYDATLDAERWARLGLAPLTEEQRQSMPLSRKEASAGNYTIDEIRQIMPQIGWVRR